MAPGALPIRYGARDGYRLRNQRPLRAARRSGSPAVSVPGARPPHSWRVKVVSGRSADGVRGGWGGGGGAAVSSTCAST
jgi:hypothetical protein